MSLVEVLPSINSLSRVEKLRLIQLLAEELADGEGSSGILANQSYPVWSPDHAFSAAETLLQTLRSESEKG
jgi:hypothetical protein